MKALHAYILFCCVSLSANAFDILPQVVYRRLPTYEVTHSLYPTNPGVMLYLDSLSLSHIDLGFDACRSDVAVIQEEGRGHNSAAVSASSYQVLDSVSRVWGKADFSTGTINDVKWSNSIDYRRLAPYVLGDDKGGDLHFRKYSFAAGYSRDMNHRLSMGVQMDYRAEIAWRDVDPRIRTIVSDLDLSLGLGYKLAASRLLGLSAGINSYSQNCDLDFYSPINDTNTYPLTGLGTYNNRFAGNTNKNSGHTGVGYHLNLQCMNDGFEGWKVGAEYRSNRMNLLLRNFNNITFAYTDTDFMRLFMAYGLNLSDKSSLCPTLTVDAMKRKGTENLFGTAAGASYDKIGSRSPYSLKEFDASMRLPLEVRNGNAIFILEPDVVYSSYEEALSSESKSISVKRITPEIKADITVIKSHNWAWKADAAYSYGKSLSEKLTASSPTQYIEDRYNMASADFDIIRLKIEALHNFDSIVGAICLGYVHNEYRHQGQSDTFYASISVIF